MFQALQNRIRDDFWVILGVLAVIAALVVGVAVVGAVHADEIAESMRDFMRKKEMEREKGSVSLGVFSILLLAVLYFVPTVVAFRRKHNNTTPIFLVNLLTGWVYGIGWIVALVWAYSDNVKPKTAVGPAAVGQLDNR